MYDIMRFMEQMEENIRFSLIYPYHINHNNLLGNMYHNPSHKEAYHGHSFPEIIRIAYRESKAFYLTDEDKKYYSAQEIEFIDKVIDSENKKIDQGMVLVDLELSEETLKMLDEYKSIHNMTLEEAVVDILTQAVKNPEVLQNVVNELDGDVSPPWD